MQGFDKIPPVVSEKIDNGENQIWPSHICYSRPYLLLIPWCCSTDRIHFRVCTTTPLTSKASFEKIRPVVSVEMR